MDNRVNSVGFSFTRENLYWVILEEHDDGQVEVKEIEKIPFENTLDYLNFLSQTNRNIILNAIHHFKSPSDLDDHKIKLSFDSSLCYISKIPIEPSLELPELKDHLIWEFYQHFYDEDPNNFYISHHPLLQNKDGVIDSVLLLIINRRYIDLFKNIFETRGLNLKLTDIDHFSVEIAIKFAYPELFNSNNFLMSVKPNFLEISFILNGNTFNFRQVTYKSFGDILTFCEKDLKPLTKLMQNKIQKFFVWGEYLKPGFINELNEIMPFEAVEINPFKNFIINKKVLNSPVYRNLYEFAPACGIALRG